MFDRDMNDLFTLDIPLGTTCIKKSQVTRKYRFLTALFTPENFDETPNLKQKAIDQSYHIKHAGARLLNDLFKNKKSVDTRHLGNEIQEHNSSLFHGCHSSQKAFKKAMAYKQNKDYTEAIIALKESLFWNTENCYVYKELISIYFKTGDTEKVLKWLQLLQQNSKNLWHFLQVVFTSPSENWSKRGGVIEGILSNDKNVLMDIAILTLITIVAYSALTPLGKVIDVNFESLSRDYYLWVYIILFPIVAGIIKYMIVR